MGSTLNRLSEGRFALGLAKGVKLRWKALNVDFPAFAHERSFVELMRKLWNGEQVIGHDSPLGQYPALQLAPYVSEDIPLLYIGFGPKSLEHAGQIYDGAHLHTFMSDQALTESVTAFRRGETAAGRA
ncbi:MAG TPA: TIGR03857 family LLM class F420-dependent oxidoreductase, partial [Gammaproteobacteria bacterium]|nr:TIGR03857 family LLM class F420-dependent oxidoreductase [Gammaproteobacteria bacterium]